MFSRDYRAGVEVASILRQVPVQPQRGAQLMVKCPLDESQSLEHPRPPAWKDVRVRFAPPTAPNRNHGVAIAQPCSG